MTAATNPLVLRSREAASKDASEGAMPGSYRTEGKGNIIEHLQPEPRLVSGASITILQYDSNGNGGVSWNVLRDATLCIAPQDEVG